MQYPPSGEYTNAREIPNLKCCVYIYIHMYKMYCKGCTSPTHIAAMVSPSSYNVEINGGN